MDERDSSLFSDYIELFESLQTVDISISQIKLGRNGVDISPVTITGVASDRQALASFRDRLLQQEMVESVDLPISSLLSDKDSNFSITVVIVNKTNV